MNARTSAQATPLHFAANIRSKDIVEALLARNADVNAKDSNGQTPLQWALGFQGDRRDVIELLKKYGAKR
jgi:ankyrin repeat protein